MARPTKFRKVEFFPESNYFVPWGKPKCQIEEIFLKVEELEAIRLKDIEKLTQEECAQKMDISRQTFQNIIDAARNKVAIALTEGKAIRITGGHYTTKLCKYRCLDCGNIYEINYKQDKYTCPECGSERVVCGKKADFCRRWCKGHNIENK
ncbi:DUF134 domain-containing protein [Clostridium cochlearium]|jgi:predicted DNA-binding protein (UPF0251 family)|uniref:UPF0251 protein NCTC13028_00250 n=1 Tax=Clostridium cochlearium TaxID=1494 RepID=A0A1G9I6Q9_CLOCO|nr:DUF134 domain-containing protein [Clostridium cochlearium]NSJ91088.1 DUF134 domain-containing protein [Coprococcus sp. MSK.21.13]MBE6064417.1 DUF134 domain-containing protein [Clostridium cochlearium]MBU5268865.1 DUF134 domain-containing protein [Clostridium cochlearium]MCG4581043.1 DUF134 domain-containing protein [Clostridium cochlearium]MCR1970568.1 DUF134 domain-containing protein [Clostridium cochlearium]